MNAKSNFKEKHMPAKLMKFTYTAIVIAFGFFVFSFISFFLFYVLKHGLSIDTFKATGISSITFKSFPEFIISSYQKWFEEFQTARLTSKMNVILFIPHLGIISSVVFAFYMLISSLLEKKADYFASIEDIAKLGMLGGGDVVLGSLSGTLLKTKKGTSSLVWFDEGLGKTTSIAIPTVLDATETSIVAVDCSGVLPKFTSGYRSGVSKVFNFNWDKLDNPEKGEYYPRWNPLSNGNMPKKSQARANYIKFISQYIVIKDINNYWEKLASLTMEALMHFFVSKIEQAMANDYFVTKLSQGQKLTEEEKNLLLSYYKYMPKEYTEEALSSIENDSLDFESYLPIGSWYNIPEQWQGRDLSFAMIADVVTYKYCSNDASIKNDLSAIWKDMLSDFMAEANLFGYSSKFTSAFQYLNHLSKNQRWVIFSLVIDSLALFRKDSIRERTSLSDFTLQDVRGIFDEELGKLVPVTVYSGAYTKESAFMTSFFIDMLLVANLQPKTNSPLLFMFDDFEMLPKLKLLEDLLDVKAESNISSVFLTSRMDDLGETYNKDILESVVNKTTYKLISSENNEGVVKMLEQMSIYNSEASAINDKSGINYVANPKMAFKIQAYDEISEDLSSSYLRGEFTKGKYLLLVDGYYDFPIKTNSMFFAKNQNLKSKASIKEVEDVNKIVLKNRHRQDSEVPSILSTMIGLGINSEEELDKFLEKQKMILTENVSKVKESNQQKITSPSSWKRSKKKSHASTEIKKIEDDSWWLGEDAFGLSKNDEDNPFGN